jgi:hypothetical protein
MSSEDIPNPVLARSQFEAALYDTNADSTPKKEFWPCKKGN